MTRIWTAICEMVPGLPHHELAAQCKSSKAELRRRILADDPCWRGPWVRYQRMKRLEKNKFRYGLAIICRLKLDSRQAPGY